jgi:hypothetical protein
MTRPSALAAGLLVSSGIAAIVLLATLQPHRASAQEATVSAVPVSTFMGRGIGESVQGLVWRGGLELHGSSDAFGGLSGLGFTGDDGRLVMVTDRGNFVSGQLIYDEAHSPVSLVGVTIEAIQNSRGANLPRPYARDAEALAVIVREGTPTGVRVGFENLTRVADFELVGGVPRGPAREVAIPEWLTATRTNQTLEAVCIAPPASPIAGSTLLLTEGVIDDDGFHSAWLLGRSDKGPLSYRSGAGTDPSDCAFLPNGDLLVLERGVALLSFHVRLKRVAAADVRPGAHMVGEILLEATGADIDNMEGIATHTAPDGSIRITLVSDDNFNDWQRSLLLEFSLPE